MVTHQAQPLSRRVRGIFALASSVDRWTVALVGLAALLTLPVLTVFLTALQPPGAVWHHLADTVLADYVLNSVMLMIGVGAGTLLIGVPAAWLTAVCEFPGRRSFDWALLLPMAIPAYIIAYTYTGLLDFAGPLQTVLRDSFGWTRQDYAFPEIRSLPGAILMLALVLYPYVYLLARAAFLEQSATVLEVSRSLGARPWRRFLTLTLPLARPSLIAGMSLAQMEALADYGTVQYFGVSTFTTGIFRVWFGMNDPTAAAQLAALLLLFVLTLLILEQWSRRQARFHHTGQRSQRPPRLPLTGWRGRVATGACLLPLLFGFLIPAGQLLVWTWRTAPQMVDQRFLHLALNSRPVDRSSHCRAQ